MFSLVVIFVLALLGLVGSLGARTYANDGSVPVVPTLVPEGAADRVMVVVTQPDDEAPMAGAIRAMAKQGAEISLVSMTAGEKPRVVQDGFTDDMIRRQRAQEFTRSAEVLGASPQILDFPDGGLAKAEPGALTLTVLGLMQNYQPSVVLTFDPNVGLYGGADHRALGQAVLDAVAAGSSADPAFPVRQVWFPTLPERQIQLVKDQSQTFRKNYPVEGPGLPAPTVAVDTWPYVGDKAAVVRSYTSQDLAWSRILPGFTFVPDWAYFRVFDMEYYYLAWENPAAG